MLNLTGKGALVIGAKRIGQGLVRRLADEGVNLAIAYRSSKAEAQGLLEQVRPLTERSILVQGDVSVEKDVERIVNQAKEELGSLFFVVNMASSFPRTPLESLDGTAWDRSLSDAKGSYLMAVHGARAMSDNPGPTRGHVLFFSDWAARETPYRGYLPYLTAKSAIDFMTRAFAVELAPTGILVNAIAPGPTMRPPEISPEEWQQAVIDRAPLKRQSSQQEMAELVVTLLKSETITGETIRVDSGRHLAGPGAQG